MDNTLEFKEAKRFAQGRSGDIVSRKHFVLARQPVARNMRPGFDIAYDVLRERERALGFPGIIDLRLHLWESLLRLNLISVYRMIVQHQSMKFAARPNRATILISFIDHILRNIYLFESEASLLVGYGG